MVSAFKVNIICPYAAIYQWAAGKPRTSLTANACNAGWGSSEAVYSNEAGERVLIGIFGSDGAGLSVV